MLKLKLTWLLLSKFESNWKSNFDLFSRNIAEWQRSVACFRLKADQLSISFLLFLVEDRTFFFRRMQISDILNQSVTTIRVYRINTTAVNVFYWCRQQTLYLFLKGNDDIRRLQKKKKKEKERDRERCAFTSHNPLKRSSVVVQWLEPREGNPLIRS